VTAKHLHTLHTKFITSIAIHVWKSCFNLLTFLLQQILEDCLDSSLASAF